MNVTQEPKYRIEVTRCPELTEGFKARLVNRVTGVEIPEDEPIFILRARDIHAVATLNGYRRELPFYAKGEHAAAVQLRVNQFRDFAAEHPDRMKEPDTVLTPEWPGMKEIS